MSANFAMHTPETTTFAERLQLHRKRLGLSQDALSDAVGVAQDTISKWERGKTSAPVTELLKLCDLFKVSADYLTGRSNHETGLPIGMFLVDMDAAEEAIELDDLAVQVPQRPALMTYEEVLKIYKEGVKSVKRRGKR